MEHTYDGACYCYFILVRFKDAWSFASALDNAEIWNELAMAALQHLEVDLGECV